MSFRGPQKPVPDFHPLLDVLARVHGGGGAGQLQEPQEDGGMLLAVMPMVVGATTAIVAKCLGA